MPNLNVILHGLFAVQQRMNDLAIHLPRLEGMHVYRAGHWLAEADLAPAGLQVLTGVKKGDVAFDPNRNIALSGRGNPSKASASAHTTLLIPNPRAIASLLAIPISPAADLLGKDAAFLTTSFLPTVHVLTYDVDDLNLVRLEGHPWQPPAAGETANLHIFSQEETAHNERLQGHAIGAFELSAGMLGLDLALNLPANRLIAPVFDPAVDLLPTGVNPLELEDLSRRQTRLQAFSQSLLTEGLTSADETATLQMLRDPWALAGAAGSRIGSCTLMVVD